MPELYVTPFWDEIALPAFPALDHSVGVDVLVVGAGLTGITTAYLLKQAGYRVALVDRGRAGGTDTRCTSAHLTVVTDTDLPSLAASFGPDHARAVWDGGFAAIDQIDRNVTALDIGCDFSWVPGFRHAAFDSTDTAAHARKALDDEAAMARDLGFDVTSVERTPLVDRPGWRIENQAVFHPRKYLRALLEAIPGDGSIVSENSGVEFDDEPDTCRVAGHLVRAPHVVIATHNPIAGRSAAAAAALLQTRLALYTSYVASATIPQSSTPPALYWDTSSPYRYVRVHHDAGGLCLIAGGEDHKTGQAADTPQRHMALERWLETLAPAARLDHRWSGQVIETADGLPLIGDVGHGQFVATGFAGNGMTFGTLAAMMVRDHMTNTPNPWAGLFGVHRSALVHGAWDYLRENADYPYYLVRDRFAGAESRSLRAVRRGAARGGLSRSMGA